MNNRKYLPRRNRVTAAFLAGFGGIVGLQRFYLRQGNIGFFTLVFQMMTQFKFAPLFIIFGIYEATKFLSMSDQEFDRRYNRYASQNRRDDYLETRREKQLEKTRRKSKRSSRRPEPIRTSTKANPFKNSGIKKYKDFDLEGAIEDFNNGLNINNNDVALHFNIACAYSLTEQKDKAFFHLEKAVELGFKDFDMIDSKDDLAFVRIQPEFDSFRSNGYKRGMKSTSASSTQDTSNEQPMDDVLLSQLNKLAELRKKGLLSTEEFNMERKKLLRR